MHYSTADLLHLITHHNEHECLEFKEAQRNYGFDDLCDYCVALANEGGGKLILGVQEKTRTIVGSVAFQDLAKVRNDVFGRLKFRIEAQEMRIQDKRIVVFDIPSRPRGIPLASKGRYLMRIDDSLLSMTPEQLQKILDETRTDILLEQADDSLTSDEVIAVLDTQAFFELLKQPYPREQAGVLKRLVSERLILKRNEDFVITKLGALLLAKDLSFFQSLKNKGVRVVTYKGNNKLETLRDLQGKKGYASGFAGLIDYINGQLPANEHIEAALRKTVRVYPDIAIRELVANAIIHQDFSVIGARVTIEIYADRIAIVNPGKPIIDEKRFIDENRSRNELLADIMRRMGICEEQGSGIDKVIASIESYQLPAPDFRTSDSQTVAVLFCPIPFSDMDRNDKIRAAYQHCCLKYVCNEKMTNQSLRERFNLQEKQADVASIIIRNTFKEGLIKLDDPENTSKRYSKYVPFWA